MRDILVKRLKAELQDKLTVISGDMQADSVIDVDTTPVYSGVIWREYRPHKLALPLFSYVIDDWHRELLCPHHTDLRYGSTTFESVFKQRHIWWGVSTPPTYLTLSYARSASLCSLCHPVTIPVSQYDDCSI